MTRFILFLLLPFGLLAQAPDCNQKGSLTTATTFTALANNTGNPICSAFVLVWNSTGFTGVTIQLEGADTISGSYSAFTAASPFANPTTALSGAIVIQATTKLAFVRVNVSSVTGTGAVNFQINGYRGVTPVAGGAGGGGSGTVGPGTAGELAYYAADGTSVIGLPGCTVTVASVTGLLCTGAITSGSGSGVAGALDLAQGTAVSPGTNAVTLTAPTAVTAYLQVYPSTLTAGFYHTDVSGNLTFDTTPVVKNAANTGTSAFTLDASASTVANALKVPVKAGATATANGAIAYDPTANNFHVAQNGADAIAVLTKVTPGNGNCVSWLNSGGTLDIGDAGAPCGTSSGGGGVIIYSSSADTFLGTQFLPPGGGAPASSTESDVQVASPAAATISNLHVEVSSALGVGVTAVFTWRDAGSSTTSTCSISGNSAKSCSDTTHSFSAAAGDLLDMQVVTTGTPAAVNVLFTSAFGTSGVGVTLVSATAPLTSSGGTTPNISATYQGNGSKIQASTGSTTTNDCVKFDANGNTVDAGAACGAGGGSPGGSNSEYQYRSGASTFGAVTNSGPVPTANWVLHNCGSGAGRGTIDTFSARKVSLTTVGNSSAVQTCIATQSLSAPPYTVIAQIEMEFSPVANQGQVAGIGLYDGTKAYVIGAVFSTATQLALSTNQIATLATSYPQTGATQFIIGSQVTLKITDDGVHRTWYYFSGGSFVQFLQEATATFLTPTDVGLVSLNGVAVVNQTSTALLYWCVSSSTTCNGL